MDAIIIGGFLGSGKTTTVINIGKELAERGHTVAIIVNEIGEVGIDGDLITKYGLDAKEITNGCICCTLKVNMKATLTELHNSYNPDFVIVEPSGIAFPNVIKREFELMNFGDDVRVSPLVTLIDGSRFKDIMKSVKVYAMRQIEDAEILAINKADLVDPIKASILEGSVQQLNPKAAVIKMSSRIGDEGFSELMKLIVPESNMDGITDYSAKGYVATAVSEDSGAEIIEDTAHTHHTHYDSRSSGLASYANDYRILEEDIDCETARLISMEIAEGVKSEIIKLSPEFVGHIKMFLEASGETVKISITSYSENPEMNIIQTAAHSGPRFKILTAVSGLNEGQLVGLVDGNVERAFSKRNFISQRLHDPHDHDHHHHHDHDDDEDDHEHGHEHLHEELDDIYDHELVGCNTGSSDCQL